MCNMFLLHDISLLKKKGKKTYRAFQVLVFRQFKLILMVGFSLKALD